MPAVAVCRQATVEDVESLFLLIEEYARRGIMLPRSRKVLERTIDDFVVVQVDEQLVGCGSLCRLGEDLVEIRSLGLAEGYKGQGLGSKLVEKLIERAVDLRIPKIMALTYEVSFFLRNGFHVVEKDIFPEKVWTDCVHCSKQHCCDEVAVLRLLG